MKRDRELCNAAVSENWQAQRAMKEMMLLRRRSCTLKTRTSEEMQGDRTLCMAAVVQNWQALSEEMGNHELCMAAVQNWQAEMTGDSEMCMATVARNWQRLQWA